MEHKRVKSSNIHSIGYDPETKTMQVRFLKGTRLTPAPVPGETYEYVGVTPQDHEAFVKAQSYGSHFAANIKPKFKGKKL